MVDIKIKNNHTWFQKRSQSFLLFQKFLKHVLLSQKYFCNRKPLEQCSYYGFVFQKIE